MKQGGMSEWGDYGAVGPAARIMIMMDPIV